MGISIQNYSRTIQYPRLADCLNEHLFADEFADHFIEQYANRYTLISQQLLPFLKQENVPASDEIYDALDLAIMNRSFSRRMDKMLEKLRIYIFAHVKHVSSRDRIWIGSQMSCCSNTKSIGDLSAIKNQLIQKLENPKSKYSLFNETL